MRAVPDVRVLDVESDADHNRSVVTIVDRPLLCRKPRSGLQAAELIDMDVHRVRIPLGCHGCCAFRTHQCVTMEECVSSPMSWGSGWRMLGIPVYHYESAALRPSASIWKMCGGASMKRSRKIGVKPERAPDRGPAVLGKAGRRLLVPALSCRLQRHLNTTDVTIANRIARALRIEWRFRFVKGMGVMVAGQAVSITSQTSLRRRCSGCWKR